MRPLGSLRSLKLKLGLVILVAIVVTAATTIIAVRAGLPSLVGAAGGIALALGCAQLLAHGTTAPLREMAAVAGAMARGERGRPVRVTTADEVGELARAFNRMTEELAETDRLRRDFVANVSHELRTPIAALQALLENAVERVSEPDPATLNAMLVQTRRLGRLVTQLLDLSRLEAGEQPFDIRPFELREVLEGAAHATRLHAPPDVAFSIDADSRPLVAGDPERVQQVVMNLLENAVRFSPRPGVVAMRATRDAGRVRLEVSDDGPGIAADELELVFERFHSGDGARRDGGGSGAGLGLAISRWIVELHGGTIHAEQRDPRGARIVVTLPTVVGR
ncbi:MAG: ATP-binding protein [Actinomycetota bacterium]|nr:ATP-binding protein [Actinomycetota bacterium]